MPEAAFGLASTFATRATESAALVPQLITTGAIDAPVPVEPRVPCPLPVAKGAIDAPVPVEPRVPCPLPVAKGATEAPVPVEPRVP